MANAGSYIIISNDGKADNLILAKTLLDSRINEITCRRMSSGLSPEDATPTLVDIEKTHILFVNAHFKPFASIAFEYNKVQSQSGTAVFDNNVQFSIPLYGDFFHDMVVHARLSAVSATAGVVPALPQGAGNGPSARVVSTDTLVPSTFSAVTATSSVYEYVDAVDNVYNRFTYQYVNAAGEVLAVGSAAQDYVHYCDFPGQRLFKRVKFDVNGAPLDEYNREALSFYQKFKVLPHKKTGWARLMGQELPQACVGELATISGASLYGAGCVVTDPQGVAPANATITSRLQQSILDGYQTPKASQPALDLWIPLIFWFNCDVRLSIVSISIPYGQRFITIDLARQDELVYTAPGNLFLQLKTERFTNADGTAAGAAITNYEACVTRTPVKVGSSLGSQTIDQMEMYINNIFVEAAIHDIYVKRIGFNLVRVYRYHTARLNKNADSMLLSNLKWPNEFLFLGIRPVANLSSPTNWHKLTSFESHKCDLPTLSLSTSNFTAAAGNAVTPATLTSTSTKSSNAVTTYQKPVRTIDTLKLSMQGVVIYETFDAKFFSDYVPFKFGGVSLNTPEDLGALMISFCFHPGIYQPSGHVNFSRSRETYLDYTSSYVTSDTTADLIVSSQAINFLLISDGSANLRYTT